MIRGVQFRVSAFTFRQNFDFFGLSSLIFRFFIDFRLSVFKIYFGTPLLWIQKIRIQPLLADLNFYLFN